MRSLPGRTGSQNERGYAAHAYSTHNTAHNTQIPKCDVALNRTNPNLTPALTPTNPNHSGMLSTYSYSTYNTLQIKLREIFASHSNPHFGGKLIQRGKTPFCPKGPIEEESFFQIVIDHLHIIITCVPCRSHHLRMNGSQHKQRG